MSLSPRRSTRRAVLGALALALPLAGLLSASPARAQYDVPYVPTPQSVVDAMLDMADVTKDDYVIDLGCGDGRIVVTAAKQFGARGLGVDLNPTRIQESIENAKQAGVTDMVEFREANLFDTDISKASVLTMYLLPTVNLKLRPVVLDTLKPGTRVVSHAFDMGEWTPDETRTVDGKQVFHWVVPAKVEGAWTMDQGGKQMPLKLTQSFQMVSGDAIKDGRLKGTEISFTMDGKTYTGTVEGNKMSGKVAGGGAWTAQRAG